MSWDYNMLGSAKVYAENNQACLLTPFILAGAMAPVTVAGTATQTLAEALAGMAFCQLVKPAPRSCSDRLPPRFRCSPALPPSAPRNRR